MVTFITFFLALVAGVQTVELAVDGQVAQVELFLDGKPVGAVEGPPWRIRFDFGSQLVPHEMEAVAFDVSGRELGRARQLVNLPRPPAEITIAFESGSDGMPTALRLYWESADRSEPLSVFAIFDGIILRPDDGGRYPLPAYDPTHVHIVRAEARFPGEISARSDAILGGQYGAKVTTELTAVPIVADEDRLTVEAVASTLRVGDMPLVVAAVEQPRGQVFMVRDHASLARMGHLRARQKSMRMAAGAHSGRRLSESEADTNEDRIHAVVPNPVSRKDRLLFPTSPAIGLEQWPMTWLATHLTGNRVSLKGQKIADAASVAGIRAGSGGAPRMVLVIISEDPRDSSEFSFGQVREYLREIRVPLHVWSVGGEPPAAWGPATDVSTYRGLRKASRRLLRELDRQWIVWVEGNHMINRIEVAPGVEGLRLAGVDDGGWTNEERGTRSEESPTGAP